MAIAANKAVNVIASSLKGRPFWTRPGFAQMAAGALGGYMMSGSLLGAVAGGFGARYAGKTGYGGKASRWTRKQLGSFGVSGPWGRVAGRGAVGLGAGMGVGLGWGIGAGMVNSIGTSFSSLMAGAPSQMSPYGQRY